uniref:Uncharacterized protein n=1 Tax=Fomitiporia mediterranea TaxID=208960 RepID=A0A5B9R9F3_9AGAM|nr:hypothetical protein Fomme_000101 [Fomitiporia mediterranea]QEG57111.1 hypothetical protein Fomme_000101 [Fomitiporia mediterranea]
MMLNRPFFIVCQRIFPLVTRYLGLPNSLIPFLTGIWSVVSTLLATIGTIPTLRLLWAFRGVIRGQYPLESLRNYGVDVERIFINFVRPYWSEIFARKCVLRYLNLVITTTILYAIKPISLWFLRFILSLVGSCLGIFWSETLSSVKFLLDYAYIVRDFLKAYINIPIPKIVEPSYLQIVGATIGSFFILGFSIITLDLWYPDLTANIPFMSKILEWVYYTFTPLAIFYRAIANFINIFRH